MIYHPPVCGDWDKEPCRDMTPLLPLPAVTRAAFMIKSRDAGCKPMYGSLGRPPTTGAMAVRVRADAGDRPRIPVVDIGSRGAGAGIAWGR